MLERRPIVGGGAITDELHPGFKCPTLAHYTGSMRADIVQDMRLESHGLRLIRPETHVFAPAADGRALLLTDNPATSAESIAQFSIKDAASYDEFRRTLERMAAVLNRVLSSAPPEIDHPSAGDLWNALKAAKSFRSLGEKDKFRLFRWGPMAVADLVAEWFDSEPLRAVVAARGVFGTAMGPWSAGSGAVFLIRSAADANPAGTPLFVRGGTGALTQAMAAAAQQAGAEIRTGAGVQRILIKDGTATGVALESGEEIPARIVISNADPKRTLLRLVDPLYLDPSFAEKMRNYRSNGTLAKVNLALDAVPEFSSSKTVSDRSTTLSGRIHIGPDIDSIERAFDASKYGSFSMRPYLDVAIPSIADPSLAPAGKHVMSIYAQFAPFKLRDGDWNTRREEFGDVVIKTLSEYAPNLPNLILKRQVISPLDLQETYGFTGGQIFHGELALDQLYTMRPLLGWARYRTPIDGLFLCGAGTHPGAGLTGASGALAARAILKKMRK